MSTINTFPWYVQPFESNGPRCPSPAPRPILMRGHDLTRLAVPAAIRPPEDLARCARRWAAQAASGTSTRRKLRGATAEKPQEFVSLSRADEKGHISPTPSQLLLFGHYPESCRCRVARIFRSDLGSLWRRCCLTRHSGNGWFPTGCTSSPLGPPNSCKLRAAFELDDKGAVLRASRL